MRRRVAPRRGRLSPGSPYRHGTAVRRQGTDGDGHHRQPPRAGKPQSANRPVGDRQGRSGRNRRGTVQRRARVPAHAAARFRAGWSSASPDIPVPTPDALSVRGQAPGLAGHRTRHFTARHATTATTHCSGASRPRSTRATHVNNVDPPRTSQGRWRPQRGPATCGFTALSVSPTTCPSRPSRTG